MKIIADENLPLVTHYFGANHEVTLKPGRKISRTDLIDADILLVRSVTRVNKELLQNTRVRFVGSATTGADHVDTQWLDQAGIHWAIAKGCNAHAVVEYVIAIIAVLQKQGDLLKPHLRAGVIGVGTIGSQVAENLKILGFEVLEYDPLRALTDKTFPSTPLENFADLDLITLHTPLTFDGDYPTYHLVNREFLKRQKPGCILLNTGRGAAIDFSALKQHGNYLTWCLDVWENEPEIDLEVLQTTRIATPHIAGYSVQSKYRGVEMLYQAVVRDNIIPKQSISSPSMPTREIFCKNQMMDWRDVILKIYNPLTTSELMKEVLLGHKESFDHLRKNFVDRHEFEFVKLKDIDLENIDKNKLNKLNIKI
ncbi:MAG: 4-phosphoerythronate dehydrogenase [Gammaproteobacteria bacterium]